MSILGRLIGTAETATRGAARGGRGSVSRPGRGMPRTTSRGMGRGRATPPAAGGIGRLVEGFLRRR